MQELTRDTHNGKSGSGENRTEGRNAYVAIWSQVRRDLFDVVL